jgi:NAD(P)-dependent dehydrogenase (short-subunit alcohol dehydrogenase family)
MSLMVGACAALRGNWETRQSTCSSTMPAYQGCRGKRRAMSAFLDHIARSERRLIVTITSGMGSLTDNTSGGSIAYRTSKAAVNMATRSVAADLAPRGITCVVVNPGWVRTDMGGASAPLRVEDSVGAMRRLFVRLRPSDSGKFFGHDGGEHPW